MLTIALLLATAQAAPRPAPRPGPIRAFGAWIAACDNVRRCEMTSIWPDDAGPGEESIAVSVERAAGPAGGFIVEIQLLADGGSDPLRVTTERGLDVRAVPRRGLLRFTGADAARIVAAMVDSADLRVGNATSALGMVSLKGSSAALRFIDAEQGRAGTVTAAVAKGPKAAASVPHAAALPRIAHVRPAGTAARFTPAMRAALDKSSGCGSEYAGGTGDKPPAEVHALGGGKTLLLLPCGNGAYNFLSEPYVLSGGGKPVIAKFDLPPGMVGEGAPNLINAQFDPATGQLGSYAKGRGLGDCGSSERYVWDGAMFRLIEARSMSECRGSTNWLAVWRAEPVAR